MAFDLPSYDDLPSAPEGGRTGWGLFGPNDNVGLFNLVTPEIVTNAAKLIRRGALFPLDAAVDAFSPPIVSARGELRHSLIHRDRDLLFDDVIDNFYPQGSSQWDALGHVGYSDDQFYNDAREEDVVHGRRNTIDHWARRGLAGRGVLLDIVRAFEAIGRPYAPGTDTAFTVDDLELARDFSGVEFRQGDLILLHTGFAEWFLSRSREERATVSRNVRTPGLVQGEEMCRYVWNTHASAFASDTFAVEVWPPVKTADKTATSSLHRMLIGQFGMALGELWSTSPLAADCADDGIYEFFFTSTPLHLPGAMGSPANALAIK